MRLIDLEPAWLTPDVFIFKNPTGGDMWLTCKRVVMSSDEQYALVENSKYEEHNVVPCNPASTWKFVGNDFNTMSVTPSLNADKSGNWHGYITKGEIVGGGV